MEELPRWHRQHEQREEGGGMMETEDGKKRESCGLFMDENALPECV